MLVCPWKTGSEKGEGADPMLKDYLEVGTWISEAR
jgi:hypothetical protein